MSADELRSRLERAAAELAGVRGARVSVVLDAGRGATVRQLAAAWGSEVMSQPSSVEAGHVLISTDQRADGVSMGVQSTEPVVCQCGAHGDRAEATR